MHISTKKRAFWNFFCEFSIGFCIIKADSISRACLRRGTVGRLFAEVAASYPTGGGFLSISYW
jgi:hypothetical protein